MKWSTSARVVFYLLDRQTRACSYFGLTPSIFDYLVELDLSCPRRVNPFFSLIVLA